MDNNGVRGGVETEGRWGGLGCWAGVGGKGRKLYLNDNLKKVRDKIWTLYFERGILRITKSSLIQSNSEIQAYVVSFPDFSIKKIP